MHSVLTVPTLAAPPCGVTGTRAEDEAQVAAAKATRAAKFPELGACGISARGEFTAFEQVFFIFNNN